MGQVLTRHTRLTITLMLQCTPLDLQKAFEAGKATMEEQVTEVRCCLQCTFALMLAWYYTLPILQAFQHDAAAGLAITVCTSAAVSQHDWNVAVPQTLGQSGACSLLQALGTQCKAESHIHS